MVFGPELCGRPIALEVLDVTARRERAACARENHDADVFVGLKLGEQAREVIAHLLVDGVETIGAVERDGGDAVRKVKRYSRIVHLSGGHRPTAGFRFSRSWSSYLLPSSSYCSNTNASQPIPKSESTTSTIQRQSLLWNERLLSFNDSTNTAVATNMKKSAINKRIIINTVASCSLTHLDLVSNRLHGCPWY